MKVKWYTLYGRFAGYDKCDLCGCEEFYKLLRQKYDVLRCLNCGKELKIMSKRDSYAWDHGGIYEDDNRKEGVDE